MYRRLLSFMIPLLFAVAIIGAQQLPDKPAGAEQQRAATESVAVPGNVDHGRYIVHGIAMCVECHSRRDEARHILQGEEFMGGPIPVRPAWGADWAIRAPRNRGLPGDTPELGVRLLTQGAVGRDGRQLQPPMPRFRTTQQDAADVVAYMKSLP